MSTLASPLPHRNISSPPTAGGFYKLPKTPNSLSKLSSSGPVTNHSPQIQRTGSLPTLVLLLDKPKKDFRAEIQRIAKVKIPSRKNFKYFHKFQNVQEETATDTSKKADSSVENPLPLLNSFSSHSCFLGIDNRKTVEVQTEPAPILKQEFADLKEFRKWGTNVVDPFIKELRKVLMSQKPASVEQYIIAYCNAKLSNGTVPDTEEPFKETAAAHISKKLSLRNNVTAKNSLIRVRSTKGGKMEAALESNPEELDIHSDAEQEAAETQIQEDYHSMSDDNASELSDTSF
jgi:hypothetical protein